MDSLCLSYGNAAYGGVSERTMPTVTSFHPTNVAAEQLSAVMADSVALDEARIYRRLFVTRFGALAFFLGTIGFGFHWLSPFASWCSVAVCAVPPIWAWI